MFKHALPFTASIFPECQCKLPEQKWGEIFCECQQIHMGRGRIPSWVTVQTNTTAASSSPTIAPLDEVEATVEVFIFANLRTFEMITFTVYVGYGCH